MLTHQAIKEFSVIVSLTVKHTELRVYNPDMSVSLIYPLFYRGVRDTGIGMRKGEVKQNYISYKSILHN